MIPVVTGSLLTSLQTLVIKCHPSAQPSQEDERKHLKTFNHTRVRDMRGASRRSAPLGGIDVNSTVGDCDPLFMALVPALRDEKITCDTFPHDGA